jgi:hypothetical protein
MRSEDELRLVVGLVAAGLNDCEISRRTGIPRTTVRDWRWGKRRVARGLIHSDGTRHLNRIKHPKRTYEYPRYQFSNRSDDIRAIFCEHLDLLEIPWRRMNRWIVAVSRREGVARLDEFIGPKR